MKPAFLLFALLLLAGCADKKPFQPGDTLVSAQDGTVLGKVVALGSHSFENGAAGRAVLVSLASGKQAWFSLDTTVGTYVVKKP